MSGRFQQPITKSQKVVRRQMYRTDFIALAQALHRSKPEKDEIGFAHKYHQWNLDITVIGMTCAKVNPSFNSDRFREVCING